MKDEEKLRIESFNNGQLPQEGHLRFEATTIDPKEKLNLIKEVMTVISNYDETNWLSDENWDIKLPDWFLKKAKNHTLEEIRKNSLLWDYGSWLDAMKYRGWEWYSSKVINESGFEINLAPFSLPFSVNPLEYLIWESGIEIESIIFVDFTKSRN